MNKIAIIGKGTVGCLAVAHFLRYTDWDIEWVYDPNIPTAFVGEGTNLIFPRALFNTVAFTSVDGDAINATVKQGILKKNWGAEGKEFIHPFSMDKVGMHFNALSFQDYMFNNLKNSSRVSVIERAVVTPETVDADFVLACTGSPKDFSEYCMEDSIPVNAAYVTQTDWDYPRFTYTLTHARKHGWVFGIPLKNRCAIGYLYNHKITSLDDVKEDMEEVLRELNLQPHTRRELKFNAYRRKVNFTDRVAYNGNGSYFLEPLEATSTGFADFVNRYAFDVFNGHTTTEEVNRHYTDLLQDTNSMICLHYLAGSVFDTPFWTHAQALAEKRIQQEFDNNTMFAKMLKRSLESTSVYDNFNPIDVGFWSMLSYKVNIEGLGLRDKLTAMWKG
jgi:hypothetical protein